MTNIIDPREKRRRYLTPDPNTAPTFLTMRQVRARTGLGEMTIRRLIEKGRFPRPVRLTGQRVAWRTTAVEAWEASLAEVG